MHTPLSRLNLHSRNEKSSLFVENWKVYSGVVSLDDLPKPYSVERILLSESYNSLTNDHDVALLKLASPVAFDSQSELCYLQLSVTHSHFKNLESPAQFQLFDIYVVLCQMELRSERGRL